MNENKRRSIILIIITIAVFLIAIIGATFAYFASNINTGDTIALGVATARQSAFTSSTNGEITFDIKFNDMAESKTSEEYIAEDNATLTVELSSDDDRATTICDYDIVWSWESTHRYTLSDVTLSYLHTDGKVYPYEFSVQVSDEVEKDLSSLNWSDDGKAVISSKTIEVGPNSSGSSTSVISARMYNIPVDQKKLFGKEFRAHISVENVNCYSVTDTKLTYYVYDKELDTTQEVSSVPKGDYKLNTTKTTCKKGGTITGYNPITGELTSNVEIGDECEIHFDKLEKIIASGGNVSSNYDGTEKRITVNVTSPSGTTIYYSLDKELTKANYTEGDTKNPGVSARGTKTVYWCAVKEDYATYCSSNDIVIGDGIIEGTSEDYNGTYDGNEHSIKVNITSPSNTTIYYSTSTELTKDNYDTEGDEAKPKKSTSGSSIVYWCAVASNYTPLCGSNSITIDNATMSVTGRDHNGTYDGNGYNITVNVTVPSSGYQVYYSTTTELNENNYKSGNPTNPSVSTSGSTPVYWCAIADNYTPVCSSNRVILERPTIAQVCAGQNAATCIKNNYTLDDSIYYHSTSLPNSAGDNSYRYSGTDVNNFVCFEVDYADNFCDLSETYQIIGVFGDQLKLIQFFRTAYMPWNINGTTTWSGSSLDTYLNGAYLSGLGTKANLIASSTWNVGGFTDQYYYSLNAKGTYDVEMTSNSKVTRKIGLRYVSDYMYAKSPDNWTDSVNSTGSAWMKNPGNGSGWTISKLTWSYPWGDGVDQIMYVHTSGYVGYDVPTNDNAVIPTFYLNPNVKIKGGLGTENNPYILGT